jgi:hypothetical protein
MSNNKKKFIEIYSNNETINNKYGFTEAFTNTIKKKISIKSDKVKQFNINFDSTNLNFYIIYSILLLLIIFQIIIYKN